MKINMLTFNIGDQYGFGGIPSLGAGITDLVLPAFGLASTVVIFYFLIGAFKYLVSGGDKNALSDAQSMITHALIGFLLLILLFLILQFLPGFFGINFSVISE